MVRGVGHYNSPSWVGRLRAVPLEGSAMNSSMARAVAAAITTAGVRTSVPSGSTVARYRSWAANAPRVILRLLSTSSRVCPFTVVARMRQWYLIRQWDGSPYDESGRPVFQQGAQHLIQRA